MDTLKRLGLPSLALAVSACAMPAFADNAAQSSSLALTSGWLHSSRALPSSGIVAHPGALAPDLPFADPDRRMDLTEQVLPDGVSVTMAYQHLPAGAAVLAVPLYGTQLAGFSMVSKSADGNDYSIGTGGLAFRYFGVGGLNIGQAGSLSTVPALANPYFSLVPSATHAGISRDIGGIKVKFGVLTTGLHHRFATNAFDPAALSPALVATAPRVNSQLLEFSKAFDHGAVSLSFMRSRDADPYPVMNGALPLFGGGTATRSTQLTGAWLLAPKLAIAAQASYGRTPSGNGIAGGETIRSNAFSLALVASDRFYPGDRLSIALSQPIRTYEGYTMADVVTGVDAGGAPIVERRVVSVEPSGRELLAELYYVRPLGKSATLGWTLGLRRHPNNIAEAAAEKLFMLRLTKSF